MALLKRQVCAHYRTKSILLTMSGNINFKSAVCHKLLSGYYRRKIGCISGNINFKSAVCHKLLSGYYRPKIGCISGLCRGNVGNCYIGNSPFLDRFNVGLISHF
jgi:hypothetical protein